MKDIYANPVLEIIRLLQEDIVTASIGDGDTLLDDDFFG